MRPNAVASRVCANPANNSGRDPLAPDDVLAPIREKIAHANIVCSTVPEIAGIRQIMGHEHNGAAGI